MRVLLLNQYYAPDEASTAQLLSDIGEGLARHGHSVRVVTSQRAYVDPTRSYPLHEVRRGVRIQRVPTTAFGRTRRVGRVADYATFLLGATRALLREPCPDVIIALSTPPMVAALGVLFARLARAGSIYWIMDVYPDLAYELGVLRRGSLTGRTLSALSSRLLRNADRVVVLGETMARRVLRDRAPDKAVVVHNWADEGSVRPLAPAENPLRDDWGWGDRFVILYSGNMGLAHEFETVLDAAEILQDEPQVLFSFVGGGPRRAEVEARAASRRLRNVEFRGYVPREQLGHSLTAPDLHLVTLRDGVQGLLVPSKIYGILAAGRPTLYVGPDEGEIADILREERCGIRLGVGDPVALARAIRAYRDHPGRLADQGRRARAAFDARFTKGRAIRAFAELVEQLAG